MSAALKRLCLARPRLTVAVAESVTSGRLQALIARTSGASAYFAGGVTAYNLDRKCALLGVRRAAAARVDCVSASVAGEMARGACRLFRADLAAATTGYAEPARGVRHPYAWVAVAWRRGSRFETLTRRVECRGASRLQAQRRIAAAALKELVAEVANLRARAAARKP